MKNAYGYSFMKNVFKIYVFIFFFSISIICTAQNLAPNYSFEQFDTCPSTTTQICFAIPWFQPTQPTGMNVCSGSSTDYFNTCCSCPFLVGTPYNGFGFQYAKTGLAYAGFACYHPNPDYREYLEVKLIDSLIAGKKYCISFYLSLANGSTCGIDSMGIYFSNDSVLYPTYQNLSTYGYIPQVVVGSLNIFFVDTLNWMLVSAEYIAQGGEKFITIGNFFTDSTTNIDTVATGPIIAYYYIDDVSVYNCDSVGINEIGNGNLNMSIYPNPTTGILNVSCSATPKEIFITDVIGQRVFTLPKQNERRIDISSFPSGIYFLNVKTERGVLVRKIIKE